MFWLRSVPLALLLAYGLAFAAAALGTAPLAWDDHPGQLYRLWHVLTRGPAPWAWNPGWWMGYPELQFYPPGFAYAGALLHWTSLGALSPAASYHVLLWVAYLAPGLTAYLFLARLLGSGWLALPGSFIALTLSAGIASGVEGGVHIGMVAARLGWALLSLLLLVLTPWSERAAPFPLVGVPLLAAITLTHPAHLPSAVAIVALGAHAGPESAIRYRRALAWLVLAAAWTGFWALPLLLHLEHTRALAWGRLSLSTVGDTLLHQPLVVALLLLALAACRLTRSRSEQALARLPWMLLVIVFLDAAVLEPLGIRWLPADRVVDGAWLAVALAGGLASGRLLEILAARWSVAPAAASIAAVAAAAALSLGGGTLSLWPRAADWPSYAEIERGLRLPDLWQALGQGGPGRVLYVRSSVPLVYGEAWYRPHTHVTALAPVLAGRAIVHGTFTHPSPVAAVVYRGSPAREPITRLAEELDGHSLFGRALAALDTATFNVYADRLGVSQVVVLDEDLPRVRALEGNPLFARRATIGPFTLYGRQAPLPVPEEIAPRRWRVTLPGEAGDWVPARVAFYPLWRALQGTTTLETRRGDVADLEVRLALGAAPVELVYAAGQVEAVGVLLTGTGLLVWLLAWWRRARDAAA